MTKDVEDAFQYIDEQLGFRLITPINLVEENRKLELAIQNGIVYHPVFKYSKPADLDFNYMSKLLESLHFSDSVIGELYKALCNQKLREVNMYSAIGDAKRFMNASPKLYGVPEESLREECIRILTIETRPEKTVYDAREMKLMFEETLKKYQLDSWDVIVKDNMGSKVLVGKEKIWINANYKFS